MLIDHLNQNQIGQISLNISFFLYLIYLLPQLFHNLNSSNLNKLSLGTHSLLIFAYLADLIYGIGREMEWQYITVSVVGLSCLLLQHFQIFKNYSFKPQENTVFRFITILLGLFLISGTYLLFSQLLNKKIFVFLGWLSQIGWFCYALPQIHKNYQLKSAKGLSFYFLIFVLIIVTCDIVSAWSLDWDLPNKVGAPISLFIKLILFSQFLLYRDKTKIVSLK